MHWRLMMVDKQTGEEAMVCPKAPWFVRLDLSGKVILIPYQRPYSGYRWTLKQCPEFSPSSLESERGARVSLDFILSVGYLCKVYEIETYLLDRLPRLDSSNMHSWLPAVQRLQGGPCSAPTHFIFRRRQTVHALNSIVTAHAI